MRGVGYYEQPINLCNDDDDNMIICRYIIVISQIGSKLGLTFCMTGAVLHVLLPHGGEKRETFYFFLLVRTFFYHYVITKTLLLDATVTISSYSINKRNPVIYLFPLHLSLGPLRFFRLLCKVKLYFFIYSFIAFRL